MHIEKLTEIIKTADKSSIIKQLSELGFTDCIKNRHLRNLSIDTLFKGELEETEPFPDSNNKRTYQGGIISNVPNYEHIEFVIVNICDINNIFPIKLLVLAR